MSQSIRLCVSLLHKQEIAFIESIDQGSRAALVRFILRDAIQSGRAAQLRDFLVPGELMLSGGSVAPSAVPTPSRPAPIPPRAVAPRPAATPSAVPASPTPAPVEQEVLQDQGEPLASPQPASDQESLQPAFSPAGSESAPSTQPAGEARPARDLLMGFFGEHANEMTK